jgi:Flp pilus assembly pilin Flp
MGRHNLCEESENMNYVMNFLKDERGQDLVEYTLLLAFVAIASAALFISAGGSINTIWTTANNTLNTAAASAAGGGS